MILALELGVRFLFLNMICSCRHRRGGSVVPILSLYITSSFVYIIYLQVTEFYSVLLECFIFVLYHPP